MAQRRAVHPRREVTSAKSPKPGPGGWHSDRQPEDRGAGPVGVSPKARPEGDGLSVSYVAPAESEPLPPFAEEEDDEGVLHHTDMSGSRDGEGSQRDDATTSPKKVAEEGDGEGESLAMRGFRQRADECSVRWRSLSLVS